MPADNLPRDVIRILSLHGPVSWWVGEGAALARGAAPVAPFEDVVFVFLPAGSPGEKALLASTRMVLQARQAMLERQVRPERRALWVRLDHRALMGLRVRRELSVPRALRV